MKRFITCIKTSITLAFTLFLSGYGIGQCPAGQTSNSYCYGQGEVNVVAFEFCPSAGNIAQSNILSGVYGGGVFPATIESLSVYEGASGSGTSGTLVAGPLSGDLSGTVITASAPDLCLIFVSNSNAFGVPVTCQDGISTALQVCSESLAGTTVTFTAPDDLCINAGLQTGLGGGSPTGGVYSGPGVTDDSNGMTYSFDPAVAGVGVHTLTYTNGGSASDNIEVLALPGVSFTALADLCIDAGIQSGLGGGSPSGGTYSGPGVTDNGNGTYDFNPAFAGLGVHTITYTEPGPCMATTTDDVEVLAACGCPVGQTNYFYCGGGIEINTVVFEVCPTAGMAARAIIESGTFTVGGNTLTVYEGASGSGMTGNLIFGPATGDQAGTVINGNFADQCLIFVINSPSGISCQQGLELPLKVCGTSIAPTGCFATFTAPGNYCISTGVQTGLSGGNPVQGTNPGDTGVYSGAGVTDDGNGMTFSFDPTIAGVGNHTVTYTYMDGMGCTAMGMDNIEVVSQPTVSFTAPADVCSTDDAQVFSGLGFPTGGVYSGTGVTNVGDGFSFIFNPSEAGVGTHTITYIYTAIVGCTGSASDDIEVFNATPASFTALDDLCLDEGVQTGLAGGAPIGGVYAGAGVSDDGNGMTYSFDPAAAGVGVHNISYTIGTGTQCESNAMDAIEVFPVPEISIELGNSFCVNAPAETVSPSVNPTGGVFSGAGVTDDGNGMTFTFDPATAGVGMISVTYTYTNPNTGCTNSNSATISVLALPQVTFTAPADLCINAGVQTGLGGGFPTDGEGDSFSGPGVTDDGNGMTYSFDPAAAGVGVHTLTFSYTDEQGCTDSASDDIEVFALPTVTFTAPTLDVCIEDPVETGLGGGMPTGGVYSGTGVMDDGNGMTFSFDPTVAAPNGGNVSLTYTFTDANGCTGTATDNVFVDPICCDLIVDCSNITDETISCRADLPAVDFDLPIVTDSCGDVTQSALTIIPGNSGCPGDVISVTRTYFLQDTDGNMAECMQTFTVVSNVAPTIMCPSGTTVECAADISVDAADATATIECGTPSVSVSGPVINGDPDCPNTTYTYTYTVTDACNRTASCDQVFTIQNAIPTIVAPVDMTVECLSDISLDPIDATVTTSCTLGSNTVISGPTQIGDSDCPGTTYTYTYTVTDACGRMASDDQVFTIQNAAPTIVAPLDMTVECLSDISLDPIDATVTTSCTLGSNTVISGPTQIGDSDCPGTTYTYTYTVTDACGRMVSDDQVFTIQNAGPTITCPADKEIECSADIEVNASDALVLTSCSLGSNTVVTGPVQEGQTDCPGTTYTFTYTTTDDCGRTASCEQIFTINNGAPIITCPADEIVTCFEDINADPNNLIVSTSCGMSFVAYVKQPLIEGGIPGCDGTVYTYIYKVIDACGRVSQCEQQFLIQNNGPTVNVPPGETVDCFEDIEVSVDDVTVTQDCPGDLTINVIPPDVDLGEVNCPGILTYTYRVRDDCNRVVEVSRDFVIADNPITIQAPADYVSECGGSPGSPDNAIVESACDAVDYEVSMSGPIIIGTPNCPGSIYQYTYTVVDACGRTASDVQNITIQNEGPSIDCPETLQIFTCEDGAVDDLVQAWIASVTSTSSCGSAVNVTNDYNGLDGYCISNGWTKVTFFATDECGRTAICSGTIIVADTEPPLIYEAAQEVLVPCNGVTQQLFDEWLSDQGGAEAIDGCWGDDITWTTNPSNPQLDCDGGPQAIIVEFIATDGCGNSASVTGIFNTKLPPEEISCEEVFFIDESGWDFVFFPDLNCSPGPGTGFEDYTSIVPASPEGCSNSYWTGGYCDGQPITSVAIQEVIIPSNSNTLKFEYMATTPDACNGNDQQESSFIKINGNTVWSLQHTNENDTYDLCSETGGGFVSASIDVSDYSGQVVIIQMGNTAVDFDNLHGNVFFACLGFCESLVFDNESPNPEISSINRRRDNQPIEYKPSLIGGSLGVLGTKDSKLNPSKFELFQNQPNPFSETTMIGFYLPEEGPINFEVFDLSGNLVFSEKGNYPQGYNQIHLDRSDVPAGVLIYKVKTSTVSKTKKMILIDKK